MRVDAKMVLPARAAATAELRDAHVAAVDQLLTPRPRRPNVVGVAIGKKWHRGRPTDDQAVLVLVTHKVPENGLPLDDRIPPMVEGTKVKTDVYTIGQPLAGQRPSRPTPHYSAQFVQPHYGEVPTIQPHYSPRGVFAPSYPEGWVQAFPGRVRPAKGGYSVGHIDITAGTIATGVYDMLPGGTATPPESGVGIPSRFYLLSNNHVLANSNAASIGDPILQPGPFDGGTEPADRIAILSRYIPIMFEPDVPREAHDNLVDAAIAEADFADIDREVHWIGKVRAWRPKFDVSVGTPVQKTGRTTHHTTGRITAVNATVDVGYGGGRVARLRDQILMTNMSAPGDSGSLITTLDGVAVGLLFAGSPLVTIANQIEHVRSLLRIEVAEQTA
jgi:hypothetical protein